MKREKIINLVAVAFVVFMASCTKENVGIKVNNIHYNTSSKTSDYYTHITLSNGMLDFDSSSIVVAVINSLDSELISWNNNFITTWGYLSDDSLNIIADEVGYNEDQPLIDFENYFNFNSLRAVIDSQEISWLATTSGEDISSDPDNHFIIDDALRTILNRYSEIKVGTPIYKFADSGYYEITDGSFSTLYALRHNPDIADTASNIILHKNNGSITYDCFGWKRKSDYESNGSTTHRIKWVIAIRTTPWNRYIVGKTKNYKKVQGKWKKYITSCLVKPYGYVSGTVNDTVADCTTKYDFNPQGYYKQKKAKKVIFRINVQTRTSSGWVHGYHVGASGISKTSTL